MIESAFLNGKVLKRTLPVFNGPAGSEAPTLKRLLLAQGDLAQFYDSDAPIRYMACIELRAGNVRGNHYHQLKEELIYLLLGELLLVVEDIGSKTCESVPLQAGDLAVIPTGIAHALQTVKPGYAIEFSPSRFNLSDTYRYPLL